MSKYALYTAFATDKNCIVCGTPTNVRSMPLVLADQTYVAPVCPNNVCRHDARNDTGNVSTTALNDSKLLETNLGLKVVH